MDLYWGERKLNNKLCDWQLGGDRRNNWHESRKKNRVRPYAVRNRNRGAGTTKKLGKERWREGEKGMDKRKCGKILGGM